VSGRNDAGSRQVSGTEAKGCDRRSHRTRGPCLRGSAGVCVKKAGGVGDDGRL
jgi:hypothetical protein